MLQDGKSGIPSEQDQSEIGHIQGKGSEHRGGDTRECLGEVHMGRGPFGIFFKDSLKGWFEDRVSPTQGV
jgi:hypothetical protein